MNMTPDSEERMTRLRNAVHGLPYGGLVMHLMPKYGDSDELQLDKTTRTLIALTAELTRVSAEHERVRTELDTLKRQREAIREFIGVYDLGAVVAASVGVGERAQS